MDDRRFLPQVLAVMEKAFAPDGVLHNYSGQRKRAYAEKYSSASWMAFDRRARATALRLLLKSFITYPAKIHPEETDPLLRLKLLARYLKPYPAPAAEPNADSRIPRTAHIVITLKHGGLEQCALQWCRERNAQHPDSTIFICLDEPGPLARQLPENTCFSLNAKRGRFPWDRAAVHQLRRLIQEHNIDILHSHNTAARQYASLACSKSANTAHIYTDHGSNPHLNGFTNQLRTIIMKRRTDIYCAVSQEAATALASAENIASENIQIIKNGVKISENPPTAPARSQIRNELGISDSEFVIGYIGRIAHEKGVDRLINAFSAMQNPATLLIIGDGPLRTQLEQTAETCGKPIIFTGERDDARLLLRAIDLFILTSRSEGLPLALLEAMAEKVPVITSAAGECATVLDNGKLGKLLNRDTAYWPAELDQAIDDTRNNRTASQVKLAFEQITQNYSLQSTVTDYEKLYHKLVQPKC
jgi:glycosyltransferase involved in cell wall biosynthesis